MWQVIVDLLIKQLVNPVQFVGLMQRMLKDGITECYECGPQKQIKASHARRTDGARTLDWDVERTARRGITCAL